MEAQSLQSLSECNQCGKKFQRKAHLLRHQQQHSGERPYSCKFCSKTFKRSDVLRDHFGRCERRGTSAIPSSLERGRKRHACDECSRLKVKCDNEVPCRKCREFGRTCVKSRPQASSPDAEVQHVEHQDASASPDTTGSDRNSISFLLNCPKETDFHERYPGTRSPSTRAANYSSTVAGTHGYQQSPPSSRADSTQSYDFFGNNMAGEGNVDQLLSSLEFESFERQTNNWPGIQMPGILWSGPETLYIDRSVLEQRALDIRHNLYQTISAQVAPILPSKEIVEAIELLSADKIAYFIKLYFRHWHKHGPIVHEPSFNPCDAAIPLVLALMALGGMYSKDPIDVMKIKVLLDILESYIYSIPGLSDEYDMPGRIYVKPGEDSSPQWQQYQLEEFQGAYLMIVLQYWTGTATARKRVRNSRFGRMVEIYRYLGMHKVQHSPNVMITDQHSFRTWIRKEAYIRTATIAMMLDNAFAIFNNITPRLQWTEIDLHFPAEDHYFAHATYTDMLSDPHGLPSPKPKIKDAFMMLFSAEETNWQEDLKLLRFGTLNAMDMQMLMHVFYTTIYSSTFATPLSTLPTTSIPTLTGPFKIALTNWKHIWDEIKTAMISSNTWETLGFQRTAETYYDAVKAVIAVFERREGRFPSDIPSDCEKGSHLKLLLSF